MGRKKLLIEEKTRVLTMLENGVPVIRLAVNLHVSRQAIYDQNERQLARLPPGTTPPRKVVTGAKKNTTARTDALIRHEVIMYPSVTAASLKKKHAQILQEVSVRTIQHRLQKDQKMPCRRLPRNL